MNRYAGAIKRLFANPKNASPFPLEEKAQLEWLLKMVGPFHPGHFYSPIPHPDEVSKDAAVIWGEMPDEIEGVDLNRAGQLEMLEHFKGYYSDIPFPETKSKKFRYHYQNPAYSHSDAIVLYCMMRHTQPRHIVEAGSGYSSCLMLDTNDRFLQGKVSFSFIEPYPQLLYSLIRNEDRERIQVIPTRLQDVDLVEFDRLEENDILFIDSTHVSKINSDVNYIFFKILPRLKRGVYIHIHDIFYPFEYPKHWVDEGRAWNEGYMLRAFLQFNDAFKIVFFSTFMEHFHEDEFRKHMPLALKNRGGCIWLQKQ